MFFALHDTLPLHRMRVAYVTWVILSINILVFTLFQSELIFKLEPEFSAGFGMIPSVLFATQALPETVLHPPASLTLLTELFLHGGWGHLLSNMLFLSIFGNNVEDAMGHLRYLMFYLLVGVISGLAYASVNAESQGPLIGASGAISGVLAAYVLLNPRARIFGLLFSLIPLRLPAIWAVGSWFAFQLAEALFSSESSIAFAAHVGGFIAGICLVPLFKAREVKLFSQEE